MAKDILGEAGLHFDELNKLRVLDPEVTQQTIELKEECKDFVDKIGQFQKIVGGLIELVDQLAKEAENEKMKAIGARNLLKSIAKQREAQQQQLQALIAEKKMQLEREAAKIIILNVKDTRGNRGTGPSSQDAPVLLPSNIIRHTETVSGQILPTLARGPFAASQHLKK
ncbi:intraflagellar transport protein 20 homolog isoform X1 [Carlito syrichta]|uniref:Intraflagellar transport protein 20 homolog isoform X1 n=1 Tax=Carlito syrichta TaxID=1868482 RepID=A0A1U7U491_CARSF|nr:intraflagellar transport protein 20 homolog isoform X1 [Carlito syrichta]